MCSSRSDVYCYGQLQRAMNDSALYNTHMHKQGIAIYAPSALNCHGGRYAASGHMPSSHLDRAGGEPNVHLLIHDAVVPNLHSNGSCWSCRPVMLGSLRLLLLPAPCVQCHEAPMQSAICIPTERLLCMHACTIFPDMLILLQTLLHPDAHEDGGLAMNNRVLLEQQRAAIFEMVRAPLVALICTSILRPDSAKCLQVLRSGHSCMGDCPANLEEFPKIAGRL